MKIIFFFLLVCLSCSINGRAQPIKKLKNKAESAVNNVASSKSQNSASANAETNVTPSSTTNTTESVADNQSTTLSTLNNHKMEYPFIVLPDTKFYFSDKPFTTGNAGAKTNFTSREFIYGRLELNGKTISEAFKLDAEPTKEFHCLNYGILITPKGKSEAELNYDQTIQYTVNNRSRPILIREDEMKNTWFNFDVLAEPSKINTFEGLTTLPENINDFKFAAGMDFYTNNNNIRQSFPANGDYTIQLVLWNYSFDDWGKPLESNQNIVAICSFDYSFSTKDAAMLTENSKKRIDGIEMSKKMKTKLDKLPDWWNKPFKSNEAMLSPEKLTPMIKSYISQWGLTYISHKIYPYSNTGWTTYTDSQTGFPVSRRSNAEIYLLYKDTDGTCHIASVTIDESYAGGGTYGSPYMKGLWNDEFIDCNAIK